MRWLGEYTHPRLIRRWTSFDVYACRDREGVARLYVHDLATGETKRLPQTEQARTPFWSPDGEEVGYFTDTRLERIAVAGGTPLLADRERESGSVDPRPRVG